MFDTFTIRTVEKGTSVFSTEKGFSLLKLLSPDPLHMLCADEFTVWVVLTLGLLGVYSGYSVVKEKVVKRLLHRRCIRDKAMEGVYVKKHAGSGGEDAGSAV